MTFYLHVVKYLYQHKGGVKIFKVEDYIGRKFKVRFNGYNHYLPFKARIISSQDNGYLEYHLLGVEVWNIVCHESEFDKIEVVEIKIKDKGDD